MFLNRPLRIIIAYGCPYKVSISQKVWAPPPFALYRSPHLSIGTRAWTRMVLFTRRQTRSKKDHVGFGRKERENSALAKESKGARKRKIHVAFFAARLESKQGKGPKIKINAEPEKEQR